MVLLPIHQTNLILTGFTGRNQPVIGQRVAQQVGVPFVNLEVRLEEIAEMSMENIRTRFGEQRLKMIESEVINEAVLRRGTVIRVNGQMLAHSDHLERLAQTGPVVCLIATLDAVLQRLHLAAGARFHDPNERARLVGQIKREWVVRNMDGLYHIDTTYLSEDEVVAAAIKLWNDLV
ncbi:MAG: hypothetical protein D6737_09470 [Chloroflexi bacterium]|nr:MAG: hypothetical protein CUN54_02270 [Phototrophicales bacterium]RMF80032.1 MAG: hypothetical protein D6737_09470 [Chloroflexota bacterium]